MGASFCLILGILLLSNILFISTEVMARDLLQELQAAEEMKSEEDARSISYHPIKPGIPRAGARKGGNPYTRPCTNPRYCRRPPVYDSAVLPVEAN
ncbi:hypothetical protein ACLOJK_032999 [Asimina triloba]